MQDYFLQLAEFARGQLLGDEEFLAAFDSEQSDFLRFNRSQVRQPGTVTQHALELDLIQGKRHAKGVLRLAGDLTQDLPRLRRLMASLRERRQVLGEDPFLAYSTEGSVAESGRPGHGPDPAEAIAAIQEAGRGRDLVGLYSAGEVRRGFASSFGQRLWHRTGNFHVDWSFHQRADKAVKCGYAGFDWDGAAFERKVEEAGRQLEVLSTRARSIEPGRYRVYLSPAAVHEVLELLAWGGFSLKAHRTRQTPLLKLAEGEKELHPALLLRENTREGVAPPFQEEGFLRPGEVVLIDEGRPRDCLVSPRSAREYSVPANGASASESPESLDLAPGELPADSVLSALGTGVYVNNLFYLNYSDRPGCRATGMTRFATFWVEQGRIVAPLNVMRFDETIYRMFGEQLVGLTRERDLLLDPSTYGGRSVRSARLPGALIEDFTFTL